jgi:hypothetical protein
VTFNPLTNPVDYVVIGGVRSPGIATIVGAHAPRRLVVRNGVGLSGATVRFQGVMLSEKFSVELRLYSVDDWNGWATFKDVVDVPPLGTRARALAIEHPILEDLGITSVLVDDVLQPVQEDDKGVWLIVIKLTQFQHPEFQASAPDGAQAGPEDPLDIENAALTAESERLLAS